jgi:predicted nuclease of predicted toxin-antitoxin system
MKKFLADESVDFRIVRSLRNDGYEVEAIVELNPSISDDEVLKMAIELEAILLTEDKDFGELTFRLRKPNKGIILIRMSGLPIESRIQKLKEVLEKYLQELSGKFTVISSKKVRIRDQK